MTATLEEITKHAALLPPQQQMALASFLLGLDPTQDHTANQKAWDQEILNRIEAIDSKSVTGIPYDEVLRQAEARLNA